MAEWHFSIDLILNGWKHGRWFRLMGKVNEKKNLPRCLGAGLMPPSCSCRAAGCRALLNGRISAQQPFKCR